MASGRLETKGSGGKDEDEQCGEKQLKLGAFGGCCGNLVQWKIPGISEGDPDEDY